MDPDHPLILIGIVLALGGLFMLLDWPHDRWALKRSIEEARAWERERRARGHSPPPAP